MKTFRPTVTSEQLKTPLPDYHMPLYSLKWVKVIDAYPDYEVGVNVDDEPITRGDLTLIGKRMPGF